MTTRNFPVGMWLGLALIFGAGLAHLALEADRGMRVEPQIAESRQHVRHTLEVIDTAQSLRRAVLDAERSERSYLLSGDAAYLESYRDGETEANELLARVKNLTADNPEQQRRWPDLERQLTIELGELRKTLGAYEQQGAGAARELMSANAGHDAMKDINGLIDAAIATERALLIERLGRVTALERESQRVALAGAIGELASLLAGGVLAWVALRNFRNSEAERRRANERFRLLVNGVNDCAIYMLDPEGRIIEWNAGAERIKGYTAEEIIGQHFSRFYTPEDREARLPQRALETAVKEGKYENNAWRVRKDGTRFFASVLIDPLFDASGRLVGFAKITRDISERMQQQQELAQYQKMDALGQLTGGIAHDFNNLVHVIKNAAELLERRLRDVPTDVRNYLDMLKRNADRAASLTQRLLAFSRRQVLDPRPIDPSTLLTDVSALLKQALGEGIAVETVVGAGVWWIHADVNQLETAILNLSLNARDAMSGSGKLTIEISNAFLDETYAARHAEVKSGQYVMIAVTDTGIGMTADVVNKAFDPFFTTKEMGQGTGLGLSQVYGFVKQSGGHASIYSEPGEGTTVKLYLPRLVGAHSEHTAARAATEPHKGASGTILVVEDDDDVCRFTAETLGDLGYHVYTARDAASALRALDERSDIDLLFTDIGLPGGMNGRVLAGEAQKRHPSLKILFTTGYTRNAVIHQGRLDPGVEMIVKPYTHEMLIEKVRQLFDLPAQVTESLNSRARLA